jgi:hypothetical protein
MTAEKWPGACQNEAVLSVPFCAFFFGQTT